VLNPPKKHQSGFDHNCNRVTCLITRATNSR
jgi:hypothetical protein